MVGLVFAPHPCALNKKCLSFYDVQIILLPFFEIFAPFGSTKKHSSLPLQIDLFTPCSMVKQKWNPGFFVGKNARTYGSNHGYTNFKRKYPNFSNKYSIICLYTA